MSIWSVLPQLILLLSFRVGSCAECCYICCCTACTLVADQLCTNWVDSRIMLHLCFWARCKQRSMSPYTQLDYILRYYIKPCLGVFAQKQPWSQERGPQCEPQCGHGELGTHCAFPSGCAHIVVQDMGPKRGPAMQASIRLNNDMLSWHARAVNVVSWVRGVVRVGCSRSKR